MFATILPSDETAKRSHGHTRAIWHTPDDPTQRAAQLAQVALAGPVAEMIYSDEQYEPRLLPEWGADWQAADEAIQATVTRTLSSSERMHKLSRIVTELIHFFSDDTVWERVARIADHLEAHEILEEDQLDELRSEGLFGS